MNMKEWEYLKAIATEGNISRAAEKLYMAQSSLSHFVKQLEADVGEQLLLRTSKGVLLTEAGEIMLNHAERMIQEYNLALSEISDLTNMKTGTVRVGISSFRGTYILPPILKKFSEQYPGVTVVLTELNSVDLVQVTSSGNLDISLVAASVVPPDNPTMEICMRDEVCLIASPRHPICDKLHPMCQATGRKWVEPKQLKNYSFILGSRNTVLGAFAYELFNKENIYHKVSSSGISALFATALVRERMDLSFSYGSFSHFSPDIDFISIGPDARYIDLALIYPTNRTPSKACKVLRDLFFAYGEQSNRPVSPEPGDL